MVNVALTRLRRSTLAGLTGAVLVTFMACAQVAGTDSTSPTAPPPVPSTQRPDLAKLLAKARQATVRVEVAQCGSSYPSSSGSGALINDHQILTAAHVVDNAAAISVQRSDDAGEGTHAVSAATVVGRDDKSDIALIELTAEHTMGTDKSSLKLASTPATVDDPITVIGYPEGGPRRSIAGVVTNLNQSPQLRISKNETKDLEGAIQLDADLQPGDSGGPVINTNGRIVGINEAADSTSDISYAVPADAAEGLISGEVPWPDMSGDDGLDCVWTKQEAAGNLSAHADSLMIWRMLLRYLVGVTIGDAEIPERVGVTGYDSGYEWAWSMLADPYKASFGTIEGFRNFWADSKINSGPVVIKGSMETIGYGHDSFDATWDQGPRAEGQGAGDCETIIAHIDARSDKTGTWQITDVDPTAEGCR